MTCDQLLLDVTFDLSVFPVQGLIFVVDSNDKERVAESAEELSKMVSDQQRVERLVPAEGLSVRSRSPAVYQYVAVALLRTTVKLQFSSSEVCRCV